MKFIVVPLAALAILAAPVQAQTWKRKPGLWEIEYGGRSAEMPDMQDRLAQMPPDKRAQMEAYMKQRGMGVDSQGGMHMRVCLKPDDVKDESSHDLLGRMARDSQCQSKVLTRTATEVHMSGVCRDASGEVSEFDGRLHDLSPEHYAADWKGRSSTKGEFEMHQSGRWVSSDCGNAR